MASPEALKPSRAKTEADGASQTRKLGLRGRFERLRRVALEIAFVVMLFIGFSAWQTKKLLPTGAPVPNFELNDLNGDRVTLGDFKGKTVLVHFWATWCGVCRQEFAALNAIHANLDDNEVLLSVVADSNEVPRVARFVREHDLKYPVLLGTEQILVDYKIQAFPTNYYVDPSGALEDRTVGLSTRLSMGARMSCAH